MRETPKPGVDSDLESQWKMAVFPKTVSCYPTCRSFNDTRKQPCSPTTTTTDDHNNRHPLKPSIGCRQSHLVLHASPALREMQVKLVSELFSYIVTGTALYVYFFYTCSYGSPCSSPLSYSHPISFKNAFLPILLIVTIHLHISKAPEVVALYALNISPAYFRHQICAKFEANRHVSDLKTVDILLLRSEQEYQESLNCWKQNDHILGVLLSPVEGRPKRSFLEKFYEGGYPPLFHFVVWGVGMRRLMGGLCNIGRDEDQVLPAATGVVYPSLP